MDRRELLTLHSETLWVLDAAGDMRTSNESWPAGRKRRDRVHLTWNETGHDLRFRDDVPAEQRTRVRAWLDARGTLPPDAVPELDALCAALDLAPERAGLGVAFVARSRIETNGATVALTPQNAELWPEDWLQEGEMGHVDPAFAVVENGRSVSTCFTVRRTARSVEAGVDTAEPERGRGLAGAVTAAWVNAALERGLVPFYSTRASNLASRRVAEKLGLARFATELGLP